jgi:hypothetical protein
MPVKVFQLLRDSVKAKNAVEPAEKKAMFWFRDHANDLKKWQRRFVTERYTTLLHREFTKQIVSANRVQPGYFYFYLYDPKLKLELPYYDKFPFVLVLRADHDRFMGLNLHYLDYGDRARLFDLLYPFREGRPARPTTRDIRMRLRVTYLLLKVSSKYKAFKPCLKEYLISHVKTPLIKVGAREWDVALFLPVESFEKKTKQTVWAESKKKSL